jgi:hypothetical protein
MSSGSAIFAPADAPAGIRTDATAPEWRRDGRDPVVPVERDARTDPPQPQSHSGWPTLPLQDHRGHDAVESRK